MIEQKGNWIYYFSKALNMKYAYNKTTGEVMTEDKVKYTPEEIDALKGKEITLEIHNLKKIFQGKVVEDEQKKPEQKQEIKTETKQEEKEPELELF